MINPRNPEIKNLPDNLEVTFLPMAAVDAVAGTITQPEVRQLGKVRKGFTPFTDRDVLFAKITPSMENGKATIATDLTNGLGFGSTEFHVLSPRSGALSEWIFYYIRQTCFRADAKANFSGTAGQLRVPTDFLVEYAIPLAPLNEQHRIVEAIETHFTRLDAAVTALKRVQANLKRYRAAVLKAACEGRLVPTEAALAHADGRSYEAAPALLARILAERRRKWEAENPGRKYTEPVAPDARGLPALPEGWCWARFDQVQLHLKNGYFKGRPSDELPGIPILRINAVRPMSVSYESLKYIRNVELADVKEHLLRKGDLLFTRYNGSIDLVGVCGLVRSVDTPMLYPDKLIRVQLPEQLLDPSFVETYFASSAARRFVEARLKSTAGQNGISGGDLKDVPLLIPPLAEQQRIVAEVERRLSLIDQLDKTVAAGLARAGRLRQSILKRAFAGKLVPQDPKDEPAAVLLERIRAERQKVKYSEQLSLISQPS